MSVVSFFDEEKNIKEKLILVDREEGNPWIYSETRDEFFAIPKATFDALSLDPENL